MLCSDERSVRYMKQIRDLAYQVLLVDMQRLVRIPDAPELLDQCDLLLRGIGAI